MTLGTVEHVGGRWKISCEPHIRARLKRVFARAPQKADDVIFISDTPENSRDLAWFLERYPMRVTAPERLQRRASEHIDMEISLQDLLAAHRPPTKFELAIPARGYQAFAAEAVRIRGGLLLADDVGLGKSITAMCPMTLPEYLPALVVCPSHMPPQWAAYLARFAPGVKVHVIKKGQPYDLIRGARSRQIDLWRDRLPDVIVINYHKLRGWAERLAGLCKYVVFDECQQLRSPGTYIYSAADHVASKAALRMGLSATPIYNYGAEFYSVIDVLIPGALGTYQEFIQEWCVGSYGDKHRLKDAEQFGSYLRREGLMVRRTRAEVGRELPPLTKIAHTVESDLDILNKLSGNAIELAKLIVAHNERFRGEKMRAAGEFDSLLRQATGVAKAPYVAEFVRILVESGERVVLFGWHREVYSIWMERLSAFNPVLYSGTETAKEKEEAKQAFIEGKTPVLIMSLRSGAGIDGLQGHSKIVVFGELDWSPGVHEQCIGRVHRDGQQDAVLAYYLMSEDGSDPVVADVLGVKREQIEGVRNPGGELAERIDTGENALRRLALDFLRARGHHVEPQRASVTKIGQEQLEPA